MMPRAAEAVERLEVDLGHHQRHLVVVAELRGVVDDDAAGGGGARRVLARHRAAGGEQRDVAAREIEAGELTHREVAAAEADAAAERALAGQRVQLAHRKVALLEHAHHGLADQAGGADDGDAEVGSHVSAAAP